MSKYSRRSKVSKRETAAASATTLQYTTVEWDFSKDGGAIGAIDFQSKLPRGTILANYIVQTLTAPTSGGSATIQLTADGSPITGALSVAFLAALTDPSAISVPYVGGPMVASGALGATVATAAFTAGKVRFHLFHFDPTSAD